MRRRIDGTGLIAFLFVAIVSVAFAAQMHGQYVADASELWRDPYHDRNTHYLRSLDLTLDLRDADLMGYVADATRILVWPPFHPVVSSAVMMFGLSVPRVQRR